MAFSSDAQAAQQVQDRLNALYTLVHEVEQKRQQSENGLIPIMKMQDEKTQHNQSKLKALYKAALSHAEQEEELLREALEKIVEIRNIKNERRIKSRMGGNKQMMRKTSCFSMLQNHAETLPLYVGKPGEKPPPLCGAIPAESNYTAKVGDMVATFVDTADMNDWILAEVVSYQHSTNKYEVDDILLEQNQKKRHTISKKFVVPLPLMRANPETDPEALFPQGTIVMALYPGTSCLYIGVVRKAPQKHTDEYEVLFYDENCTKGYSCPMSVAQRYIIAVKQKSKS
ncbi:SAGA-associated factor 29-like [Atheta coriaria]|uniref:SAGA-associated factor 29-like n=1 Tax=Dalotia coriaria TaxID=877792 RepID=UPI0031F40725